MKASDLRIGCFFNRIHRLSKVHLPHNEVLKVLSVSLSSVEYCSVDQNPAQIPHDYFACDIKDVSPIPLTEEWFRKFVFKVTAGYFRKAPAHLSLYQSINNMWVDEGTDAKCEYVHQLQNLYFALTGNELMMEGKDKVQNEWGKEHGQQTQ